MGPALHHYRCVQVYFPTTRSIRACDTVEFFSTVIPFPEVIIADYLRQAASNIISTLTTPPSSTYPSLSVRDPVRHALLEIATRLKRI